MDKKMSNEEMVKEAVEEAKKAAEAEAKEQEAKGQEPEDAEETEATEEEAVGKETNSEDTEEPKKKKLFEKKNKKDKKDEQIADLQAKLLKSDLQKKATASLEKDGYPVGLAELLDYTSEEAMEKSLSKLTETFKGSLQAAVESRLRGKTPAGLGNAASAENMLRDQIARNIRGL